MNLRVGTARDPPSKTSSQKARSKKVEERNRKAKKFIFLENCEITNTFYSGFSVAYSAEKSRELRILVLQTFSFFVRLFASTLSSFLFVFVFNL
jgi:hypothetical protein